MNKRRSTRVRLRGNQFLKLATATLACLLASCDSKSPTGQLDNSGALSLGLPEQIRTVSAVNINNVTATATVNGQEYLLAFGGDRFSTTISLDPTDSLSVTLRFEEALESGISIALAQAQRTIPVTGAIETIVFEDGDFDTEFDFDSDTLTNLRERELGTDPTVFTPFRASRQLSVTFAIPAEIPFPAVTQPRVAFADIPRPVTLQGGITYSSTGSVTTTNPVSVEVLLQQQILQGTVFLATAIQVIPVGFDDLSITLEDSDFDFSRDDDGDGLTNLVEVRNGTDPFTAN